MISRGALETNLAHAREHGLSDVPLQAEREIDRAGREASQQLVVISTGDVAGNRAMGLSAPILLDDSFDAGRRFGAGGTPSAVRVDAQGRVSSPVAAGADAVLALARGRRSPVAA